MRKLLLLGLFVLVLLIAESSTHACKYSVRDLGFIDIDVRPYRLVMFFKGPADEVKEREALLRKEMHDSNIVLVTYPVDQKDAAPDVKPVKVPSQVTVPQFWLIAPDDRSVAFDPAFSTRELLQSPMRHALLHETTRSLAAVLLLESKDEAANQRAKEKAERVLAEINQVLTKLDKAPLGDVKLLVLPTPHREQERWTLWGLGEEVAETATPKIAVLFGRLRRAGALLEGTEWPEAELFARIAALGQCCEDDRERSPYEHASLPFRWSKTWHEELIETLQFNPASDAVKKEVAALLQKPAPPEGQRKPRTLNFGVLLAGTPKKFDPNGDPLLPRPKKGPEDDFPQDEPVKREPNPLDVPSIFASQELGLAILIGGIAGWIGLGVSVWLLERKQ